jgi:hypothetical protein
MTMRSGKVTLLETTGGSVGLHVANYETISAQVEASASAFGVGWLGCVEGGAYAPMRFEALASGVSASSIAASGLYSAPCDSLDYIAASVSGVGGGTVSIRLSGRSY